MYYYLNIWEHIEKESTIWNITSLLTWWRYTYRLYIYIFVYLPWYTERPKIIQFKILHI